MKLGILTFATDYSMDVSALAPAVEERGFDSLWLPEHTHIPVSRKTPYPGGTELPRQYSHSLDPFVGLAVAAAHTTTLKLGTGICLIIERDIITTAKAAATLDHVSGGRLLFGLGGGWNREEMENHGTDYGSRFQLLEEQMQALNAIWTQDEAEFHGRHIDFDPIWVWPKPISKPRPPIYLGGETDHTLRRIIAHGDGWLPRMRDPKMVLSQIERLRTLAAEAGRDASEIDISAFGVASQTDLLKQLRDAGVGRAVLPLPSADDVTTLHALDGYAGLSEKF